MSTHEDRHVQQVLEVLEAAAARHGIRRQDAEPVEAGRLTLEHV